VIDVSADSGPAGPVAQFCADLRRRWQSSGRDLAGIAREISLSRTQLYAILGGEIRRPPNFETVVRPFVLACGGTEAEAADWRRRHGVLVGVHEELRSRPAAITAGPNQLPAAIGSFTGRAAALAALDAVTVPVVVVSGPPGVGKTSLAVHWAHQSASVFPDGQLYVDLRGFARDDDVVDPAEAVRGFLDALGVPAHEVPVDRAAQGARLRGLLAGRRVLVVLDNARDADQVRPLLVGGAGVRTVVTSRGPLTALVAEMGAAAVVLAVPDEAEAAALLRARLDDVPVADDTVAETVAACGRLPLALALVAARVRQTGFPLAMAATELRRQGSSTIDALQAVFSWSSRAVSPEAGRLFRLLGLTTGLDIAADAVAALAGVPDARATLGELVDAGLVVEHRPGRYVLPDLLREHAAGLARDHDSDEDRRDALTRLLDFYTRTAYEADRVLNPIRAPIATPMGGVPKAYRPAIAWLDAERSVLLSALRQARDEGLDRHAWQLGWALDTFLYERRHWQDEGAAWAVALRAATALVDQRAAAHAHRFLGVVAGRLDRFADAYRHLEESNQLCVAAGDRAGEAETEYVLSYVCWLQGEHDRALEHVQRSLDLWTELAHPAWEGRASTGVGWYRAQLGDHAAAVPFYRRAVARYQQAGDRANEAVARDTLGQSLAALGSYPEAVAELDTGRALARELGDPVLVAQLTTHLGDAYDSLADYAAARERWEHAAKLLADTGHPLAGDVARRLATPRPAPGETIH